MDDNSKFGNESDEDRRFRVLVVGCTVVAFGLTALILFVYFINFHDGFGNQDRFGQFGDFFGGILNPAVAFCALIALLFGIRQQRKELQETRNQFSEQSFDSMFFQMLQLHNDMVSSIDSDIVLRTSLQGSSTGTVSITDEKLGKGRESFQIMYKAIRQKYWDKRKAEISQEHLDGIYLPTYQLCQSVLGHYFRYLYNVFQFIDSADIKEQKKLFYGKLVRAQLSNHELSILYYNCLSQLGNEKFKPLVEQYGLFKNLPVELLLRPDHYVLYEQGAWGNNYDDVKNECQALISMQEHFTPVS